MTEELCKESIMVTVGRGVQLHLCHLHSPSVDAGPPVLMVHGIAEDGRIFWSNDGRGLGPFLARAGYDVFVADLRGCGRSWPSVSAESEYGYHELVNADIPALVREVARRSNNQPQTWISHSSGGPLLLAALLRHGKALCEVSQMVHFGARRRVCHSGWRRVILYEMFWHRLGRLGVAIKGYFPAASLRLGVCDASAACFYDDLDWSREERWTDRIDGFDYSRALADAELPRSLYFTIARATAWSHPQDVRQFLQELGPHDAQLVSLGKNAGNLSDYGHLEMLIHPDANDDHFQQLLGWMRGSGA